MFQRMGATAPPNVIEKVIAKVRDTPTAPKLAEARRRLDQSRRSVGRVVRMLDGIAKDRNAPSTARELSQDLLTVLQREYRRLETAVHDGRDPSREKGEEHMLRSTPISAAQAKTAKQTLANTASTIAARIANPSDRLIFEQASKVIGKVVGLQLDARVVKTAVAPRRAKTSAAPTASKRSRSPGAIMWQSRGSSRRRRTTAQSMRRASPVPMLSVIRRTLTGPTASVTKASSAIAK